MLIIKIQKGGKVEMLPTGYPGAACRRMTAHYSKYMAGDVKSDVPTEEAYEQEKNKAKSHGQEETY